jgi:hypothetical protein
VVSASFEARCESMGLENSGLAPSIAMLGPAILNQIARILHDEYIPFLLITSLNKMLEVKNLIRRLRKLLTSCIAELTLL